MSELPSGPSANDRLLTPARALALWTALALVFASSNFGIFALKGEAVPVRTVLLWAFGEWYLWAAMAPAILALQRAVPFAGRPWPRPAVVHAAGAAVAVLVHETAYVLLDRGLGTAINPPESLGRHLVLYYTKRAAFDLCVYAAIVLAGEVTAVLRRARARELRAAQLETQLTQAQLDALKRQLEPHFLFNALNTVASLLRRDPDGAERVVTRLGDLLRCALQQDGRHTVPLRTELELLERYLDIQRARFRDRLRAAVEAEPAALDVPVPSLILQPLVENAVHHAVEPRETAGRITVRASVGEGRLRLEVEDDGPGPDGSARSGNGVGLANTRARLAQLYGADHAFALTRSPHGGTLVRLDLPSQGARA